MMHRFFALILGVHLVLTSLSAHVLIIHSSDWHADLERMVMFIKSISLLSQDFLVKNPEGTVILALTGDLTAGDSTWTSFDSKAGVSTDYGECVYLALEELARHYEIVLVPGNHEQFDWHLGQDPPVDGRALFVQFHRRLIQAVNRVQEGQNRDTFRLLGANIVPGRDAQDLFKASTDIPLRSGGKLRFVGLGLVKFFEDSGYHWCESPTRVIDEVRPMLDAAIEQLKLAASNGVDRVIFAIHDDVKRMLSLANSVKDFQKLEPSSPFGRIHVPLWLGGHDHNRKSFPEARPEFMQCGSNHDFYEIVLDGAFFQMQTLKWYDEKEQIDLVREGGRYLNLRPGEQAALSIVERRRDLVQEATGSDELGISPGFSGPIRLSTGVSVNKTYLKGGPKNEGGALASSLADYGRELITNGTVTRVKEEDVFGFFHSSSFRRDKPLPALIDKSILNQIIADISPWRDPIGVFEVTGEDLQSLFSSLRWSRIITEKGFSPQISLNLKEEKKTQKELGRLLSLQNGRWVPLNPKSTYLVVLDHWSANSMFRIEEWTEILGTNAQPGRALRVRGKHPTAKVVFKKYLWGHLLACAERIANLPAEPKGNAGRQVKQP